MVTESYSGMQTVLKEETPTLSESYMYM